MLADMIRAALLALALQVPSGPPPSFTSFMPPVVLADPAPLGGVRVQGEGVVGNWWVPPAAAGRRPAVLVLGGSEGGLGPGAAREAQALAREGYAVLQLAYFGAPGQPKVLKLIPLETFDRGLAWLRARPEVDARRVAVVGTSKGAEAALLIASADPGVRAVVAASPSSVVWSGIDMSDFTPASSWSRGGAPRSFLRFGSPDPAAAQGLRYVSEGYRLGMEALPATPDAAIPLERTHAAVMLVCGGADALWPSCPMAEALKARLTANEFVRRVELLRYPDAGHAVFGPPVEPSAPGYAGLGALGGAPEANDAARREDWPKALAFLRRELGG